MTRLPLTLAARGFSVRAMLDAFSAPFLALCLIVLAREVADHFRHADDWLAAFVTGAVAVRVTRRRDESAGDLWTLGADDFGAPTLRPLAARECLDTPRLAQSVAR